MSLMRRIKTFKSIKEVLRKRNYLIGFLVATLVIFSIFVAIPVYLIPANSVSFQLTIFTAKDYFLLSILSLLTSLMIIMQIYIFKTANIKQFGKGAVGGYSGVVAATFGTASCSSCVAALFGFLGIGTVFFLIQYRWAMVSVAIAIMLVSLYLTSLTLNGVCKKCGNENE